MTTHQKAHVASRRSEVDMYNPESRMTIISAPRLLASYAGTASRWVRRPLAVLLGASLLVGCSDSDGGDKAGPAPTPISDGGGGGEVSPPPSTDNGSLPPLPDVLPRYLAFTVNNGFKLIDDLGVDNDIYFTSKIPRFIEPDGQLCALFRERHLLGIVDYQHFFATANVGGGAAGVEAALAEPTALYTYFEEFKESLKAIDACGVPVIYALEADPMSMAMNQAKREWDFDPTKFPARIHDSGHPDAIASGAPDSFAGFCKVLEYLRDVYAPGVLLAPTIKVWATSGAAQTKNEPEGGWATADGPKADANFWMRMGVHWDLLTTNWAPKERLSYDVYRSWARYFAAVASAMGTRVFIWKTDIQAEHLDASIPVSEWNYNLPQYYFDDAQYLADLGYVILAFGYGVQMSDSMSPAIGCWLQEYYGGKEGNCVPHSGTIGKVMLPE